MRAYSNLVILGITGIILLAFSTLRMLEPWLSFGLSAVFFVIFLLITFANVRISLQREYEGEIQQLKETYEKKIRRLKHEHDTTTLEKTIRNGTKTLIKNAVDYFKIENIKNEMPPSAAIQNLQLDKYGQIIELLADFSLILPDYEENRQIVLQEIHHQIDIFQIDEKAFADFLRSIMDKYLLTVNKKIREKIRQNTLRQMKTCPNCYERIPVGAKICRHCSHSLTVSVKQRNSSFPKQEEWFRKGNALLSSGKTEEAIRCFSQVIRINPKAKEVYYARGVAYQKVDNDRMAMEDFKTAGSLGHAKARDSLHTLMFSRTQEEFRDGEPGEAGDAA
ncbi:MAG: tetratricopeptide repeat protein [Desulfobacterales bacterium]